MKYYYVSFFHAGGGFGAMALRQHLKTDGQETTLNIAVATQYIIDQGGGLPVVILSWQEINEERFEQFSKWGKDFTQNLAEKFPEHRKKAGHLSLVKQEEQNNDPN